MRRGGEEARQESKTKKNVIVDGRKETTVGGVKVQFADRIGWAYTGERMNVEGHRKVTLN